MGRALLSASAFLKPRLRFHIYVSPDSAAAVKSFSSSFRLCVYANTLAHMAGRYYRDCHLGVELPPCSWGAPLSGQDGDGNGAGNGNGNGGQDLQALSSRHWALSSMAAQKHLQFRFAFESSSFPQSAHSAHSDCCKMNFTSFWYVLPAGFSTKHINTWGMCGAFSLFCHYRNDNKFY